MSVTILGDALWGKNIDLGPAPSDSNDESGGEGEGEGEEENESGGARGTGDEFDEDEDDGDDGDDESDDSGEGSSEQADDGNDSGDSSDDASGKSGEDGDEDGEDGDEGEGQKPGHQDAEGGPQGEEGERSSDGIADTNEGSNSAGGGAGDGVEDQDLAQQLLAALEAGGKTGLKDSNQALGEAASDAEAGEAEELPDDEQAWRPYSSDGDQIYVPNQSAKELATAQRYKKSVKAEIAALKAKLRAKFLQARAPKVLHGVRKGDSLSLRSGNLVNTSVEIRSGRRPSRPDQRTVQQEACTIATAIVIDQSGSMDSALIKGATQAAIAISTALDSVGSPVLVCSPRDGGRGHSYKSYSSNGRDIDWEAFHRFDNITLDLFKDWGERMNARTLSRFGGFTSTGSTPLSDGIQFALQELDGRRERHRVVFVITDGHPNNSKVVRHQIRTAGEAGVTIVGVGIGYGASYVSSLFPVHVYRADINGVAGDVLECLSGMVFPKRAKKLNLSGQRIA